MTHDGQIINTTTIPTGDAGNESSEASLHKVFLFCGLPRGKDIEDLPTSFLDNFNDTYEDLILNANNNEFQPPGDFMESFITGIVEANA
jgi:hypothetical protein